MNFYKKAILATAITASFGASAAVITPSVTQLELSKEGIANNIAFIDTGFDINIKADVLTPSGSSLKVVFGTGIDLSSVVTAAGGATSQSNSNGAGKSTSQDVELSYGSGSFTFDNVVVNTDTANAHFVTFDLSIGQPIAAGAAFNLAFINAHGKVGAASSATYTATDGGVVIDSGSGAVAKEVEQFTFAVKTPFDKLINRDDPTKFVDEGVTDSLILTVSDNATLKRAITATSYDAVVTGNFKDSTTPDYVNAASTIAVVDASLTVGDIQLSAADGTKDDLEVVFTATGDTVAPASATIPVTGDLKAKYTITGDFSAGTYILAADADAGEWAVDATIINVPYFPVGYDGVTSTIQLANEGSSDVDIIVSANDQDGNQYGPVNLDTLEGDFADGLAKDAVTKLSAMQVMTLLSAPAESNLSITFNVDANEGVVNGYAFTQKPGTGRTEISTSQQRGN